MAGNKASPLLGDFDTNANEVWMRGSVLIVRINTNGHQWGGPSWGGGGGGGGGGGSALIQCFASWLLVVKCKCKALPEGKGGSSILTRSSLKIFSLYQLKNDFSKPTFRPECLAKCAEKVCHIPPPHHACTCPSSRVTTLWKFLHF